MSNEEKNGEIVFSSLNGETNGDKNKDIVLSSLNGENREMTRLVQIMNKNIEEYKKLCFLEIRVLSNMDKFKYFIAKYIIDKKPCMTLWTHKEMTREDMKTYCEILDPGNGFNIETFLNESCKEFVEKK
jgi:hypothetical protein